MPHSDPLNDDHPGRSRRSWDKRDRSGTAWDIASLRYHAYHRTVDTMLSDPLVGRMLDGRYRVGARLARGGMATVYLGEDIRLERSVAIKVMHPSLAEDEDFVARFVREARSAARLSDPNVVTVYDQGSDGRNVFLVMEYVPGRTLRDVLAEQGRLPVGQALDLLEPVLDALAAAHAAGIVHRDIKPENVLITRTGGVKVADFGLARTTTVNTATTGVLIGTVAYLSPELVERGIADARSDVYSAGVLLYELVTGRTPFSGETALSVAYQHVNETVPAPSESVPDLPAIVDHLVLNSTSREPGLRYRDGREFADAVRAARADLGMTREANPIPLNETLIVSDDVRRDLRRQRSSRTGQGGSGPVGATGMPHRRWRGRIALLLVLAIAATIGVVAWNAGKSPGVANVSVPSVVGSTTAAAESALTSAGLTVGTTTSAWSNTVAPGHVVSTDPTAGASLASGGTVDLVVSKGVQPKTVPTLTGTSLGAAEAAIKSVGLTVGTVSHQYSTTVPSGRVISSQPTPGASTPPGSTVDLVVSKGPAPVAVPKVVGQTQAAATAALTAAGFKTSATTAYSTTVATGKVVSQSPASGTAVPGSTVSLVVSKGPPPVTVPDVVDMHQAQAEAALQAAGLKVSVNRGSRVVLDRVISQTPAAGSTVPRGTTVTITII
jgi:eukaryotic-like serine/threonine-protein kinase